MSSVLRTSSPSVDRRQAFTRSVDLRASSEDLLLPTLGSGLRTSYNSFQDLSPDTLSISPENERKKRELIKNLHNDYPIFQFEASLQEPEDSVRTIIHKFFPYVEELSLKKLVGGITNMLFLASGSNLPKVLVRICGQNTEQLIDRELEFITLVSLATYGVSPQIFGRFLNGLVYDFVEGRSVEPEDLKDPLISRLIAEHLGYFHAKCEVAGVPRVPVLFQTITQWLKTAEDQQPVEITEALSEIGFSFEKSRQIVQELEDQMDSASLLVCYCHNDLLSGNVIFHELPNGKSSVHFIDFEYGGYNYRGFDIGNHFCEMMGFELDSSRYPSEDFQREWLQYYLKSYLLHSQSELPRDWDRHLESLRKQVELFSILAHLFWGIWAVLQHQFSTEKEFDYLQYAKLRLSTYMHLFNSKGRNIEITACHSGSSSSSPKSN